MTRDDCGVPPPMYDAAQLLQRAFPFVAFTSGRRGLRDQAEAMAANILAPPMNRDWIRQTYKRAAELQTYVDLHPEIMDSEELADGLHTVLVAMGDDAAKVSDHLIGMAVDLKPLERLIVNVDLSKVWVETEQGRQVIAWIRAYPQTKYFTTREGGRRRWHFSVKSPVVVSV